MSTYPFEVDKYWTFRDSYGFVELTDWSSVSITGNDRQTFLHNFCTNDIRRLGVGQSCEAFVTNVKGRIVGHGLVTCREEELVFTTVPGQGPTLLAHLDRYIIREDVQVRDTSSERAYLLLAGGPPASSTAMALAPTVSEAEEFLKPLVNAHARLIDVPIRWICWNLLGTVFCGLLEMRSTDSARARQILHEGDAAPTGPWPEAHEAIFHALRIEAGTLLFGVDFDDRNFPQEVGRNKQAISFTKGCYLGQETVARIDALGHVNQQLAGVRFAGSNVPEPGGELTHAGKCAGHVTSATFSPQLQVPLALAMLRREHTGTGSLLDSSIGPGEVIPLPVSFTRFA
jgi:folate-binding protein YgfZ